MTDIAAELAKTPDLRGLSPLQRSQIANWSLPSNVRHEPEPVERRFPSSKKPSRSFRPRWPAASSRPRTSPGSISRDCRSTIAMARRSDPCSRSILASSPTLARAMPSARPGARAVRFTASRSSSRTTSTRPNCRPPADRSRSLDHRPRLDSRVAAGMKQRRRGHPGQGEPRRVSVRRLRHQHRRRHGRQRLRSVAQHRRDRAAAAPPRWRRALPRSASAPTPATRSRTRAGLRRSRRFGRRADC